MSILSTLTARNTYEHGPQTSTMTITVPSWSSEAMLCELLADYSMEFGVNGDEMVMRLTAACCDVAQALALIVGSGMSVDIHLEAGSG